MTGDARAARWSSLHHGIDPAGIPALPRWLTVMWALARPLARWRVPPTAITLLGVASAVTAAVPAHRWPVAAGALVLLAALCDALDGAVAVVADRATRSGAAADAIADRVSDLAFAAVLWRCGAPAWIAVAAGALAVTVDLLRRARRVPAVITVGERPSWTVCALIACGAAALTPAAWPAEVCSGVWTGLGVVAVAQVALAGRHRQPPPSLQ